LALVFNADAADNSLMSTFLIAGIGALAWFLVCLIVLAACMAARRGDEALSNYGYERSIAAHRYEAGPAEVSAVRPAKVRVPRRWRGALAARAGRRLQASLLGQRLGRPQR